MEVLQTILLGVSVLINIVLIIGIRNLNKQTEQYQDYIESEITTVNSVIETVEQAYQRLEDADIRGSFESDDEIGATFADIKNIVQELKEKL